MTGHLHPLHEALERLDEAWGDADEAGQLSRRQLIAVTEALGLLHRRLGAMLAEVAACVAHESRTELGAASLAKEQGFRSAAQLIATTTGATAGDASRLVKVGEATAPRRNLLGEATPPKYPAAQRALAAGTLSAPAVAAIIALLDRVRLTLSAGETVEAERLLVDRAQGLSLDDVRRLVTRAEAWLDPDGVAPREQEQRDRTSLSIFERDGRIHLDGDFDAARGAPIVAAVNGYVSALFAAQKEQIDPEAPDAARRSVAALRAEALSVLCAHALGCEDEGPALAGASVVVRIDLNDLADGTGYATIDGSDLPISVSTARRLAAGGGVIPCVLGTDREILDYGRERRFFTRAQRLALAERDGGCAMCGLPPSMTRAHHIRWWKRDAGPTDLENGVLLCESCHHRIHDNDWQIRIEGTGRRSRVWFIPPPHVDPNRTPRLGGRARYDVVA
ncbi:HNH endonuclease [Microbacterium azadirachtae]|uniref:HNH endonuclease n=1 Tax=Microbacterium azadirachtae TaxID=582680 RepID=UPI0021D4D36E|nr:HNH endonuclease signature motif containing protein [Microbacterium azadirachtae]UXW86444.1 HNH endonuclease [Microbacterium azadirachtae]